jgi:hypothetical protein
MGKMELISVGGGEVSKGDEVVMEGRYLLLERGEVDGDGDKDVGHLGCNLTNRVKNNVVVVISESFSLRGLMDKKTREDEARAEGQSEEKLGSDHMSRESKIHRLGEPGQPKPPRCQEEEEEEEEEEEIKEMEEMTRTTTTMTLSAQVVLREPTDLGSKAAKEPDMKKARTEEDECAVQVAVDKAKEECPVHRPCLPSAEKHSDDKRGKSDSADDDHDDDTDDDDDNASSPPLLVARVQVANLPESGKILPISAEVCFMRSGMTRQRWSGPCQIAAWRLFTCCPESPE